MKVAFFGHFDGTNFGNECSLQTALYHLHQLQPDARVTCICSGPPITARTYGIEALPLTGAVLPSSWARRSAVTRAVRKICVALSEPLLWLQGIRSIRGVDILVIPGTGLLTDAYGLRGWGPYGLLKWSLIAKACGSKLAIVSVGAGPLYGTIGKWFTRLTLALADFRSFRDDSTLHYLKGIGLAGRRDEAVFPDLVFSFPECIIPPRSKTASGRPVVGLGVMEYAGRYSDSKPTDAAFSGYLGTLVEVSGWLLDHGYNIRLLSGDLGDSHARESFRHLLEQSLPGYDGDRIIDEPVNSVADVLSQITATDFVIATRFHNIVFGFLCGRPVISISFHHKCESLMAVMGMTDYCLQMGGLKADQLIDTFRRLEENASTLQPAIGEKIEEFRQVLDQQYEMIFGKMELKRQAAPAPPDRATALTTSSAYPEGRV